MNVDLTFIKKSSKNRQILAVNIAPTIGSSSHKLQTPKTLNNWRRYRDAALINVILQCMVFIPLIQFSLTVASLYQLSNIRWTLCRFEHVIGRTGWGGMIGRIGRHVRGDENKSFFFKFYTNFDYIFRLQSAPHFAGTGDWILPTSAKSAHVGHELLLLILSDSIKISLTNYIDEHSFLTYLSYWYHSYTNQFWQNNTVVMGCICDKC
jgi:hypothetical protein